jgi:hypothetical protein
MLKLIDLDKAQAREALKKRGIPYNGSFKK